MTSTALTEVNNFMAVDEQTGVVHFEHGGADPLVVRAWINQLKDELLTMPGEHMELPAKHSFCNGMYMRELFIPKGTLLIGKIHKDECINIVSKGDIAVLTETGAMRVGAGYSVVTPPGMQKVGYAHEDTIFINVFRTDETDVEKLEKDLVWESFAAMEALNGPQSALAIEGEMA